MFSIFSSRRLVRLTSLADREFKSACVLGSEIKDGEGFNVSHDSVSEGSEDYDSVFTMHFGFYDLVA